VELSSGEGNGEEEGEGGGMNGNGVTNGSGREHNRARGKNVFFPYLIQRGRLIWTNTTQENSKNEASDTVHAANV
jgi:hypothetical protein